MLYLDNYVKILLLPSSTKCYRGVGVWSYGVLYYFINSCILEAFFDFISTEACKQRQNLPNYSNILCWSGATGAFFCGGLQILACIQAYISGGEETRHIVLDYKYAPPYNNESDIFQLSHSHWPSPCYINKLSLRVVCSYNLKAPVDIIVIIYTPGKS